MTVLLTPWVIILSPAGEEVTCITTGCVMCQWDFAARLTWHAARVEEGSLNGHTPGIALALEMFL